MNPLDSFLSGGIAMQCLVIALAFLRQGEKPAQRYCYPLAGAFLLFAIERILWLVLDSAEQGDAFLYLIRFAGFALILFALPRTKAQQSSSDGRKQTTAGSRQTSSEGSQTYRQWSPHSDRNRAI
jgi:hypothetical protein